MIERARGVQGGQAKQAVGQYLMDLLHRMKDIAIRSDAEVDLNKSEVKGVPVPDIGDNPENWDEDQQHIEEMVRRKRNAAIEFADVGREIGRFVRRSPPKPGDDEGEVDEPDAAMNVDPERLRFLWDIVEQEAERSEENNQRRDGPVEGDGGRAVPRGRGRNPLPGRENVHQSLLNVFAEDSSPQRFAGWCRRRKAFLWLVGGCCESFYWRSCVISPQASARRRAAPHDSTDPSASRFRSVEAGGEFVDDRVVPQVRWDLGGERPVGWGVSVACVELEVRTLEGEAGVVVEVGGGVEDLAPPADCGVDDSLFRA